jgi:hypothetical protein
MAPIDPDNVPVLHSHLNPETGAIAVASWPCAQCKALGRTEPLKYGRDVPDEGNSTLAPVPPERLEAYLASFGSSPGTTAPPAGSYRARRAERRRAKRQARRGRRSG